jgi:hypothetical protein
VELTGNCVLARIQKTYEHVWLDGQTPQRILGLMIREKCPHRVGVNQCGNVGLNPCGNLRCLPTWQRFTAFCRDFLQGKIIKSPSTISGLKPATTYVFQARAVKKTGGHSDWSDSVTRVAM